MGRERATIENSAGLSSSALIFAILRLLAIALDQTRHPNSMAKALLHGMPDYRNWPTIALPGKRRGDIVRFFVCSKGVLASDEQSFPVGTQFVMERIAGGRPAEVFIMKKYAALYRSGPKTQGREVWMTVCCRFEDTDLRCGETWVVSR